MTATTASPLTTLVDLARNGSTHHRTVGFGPIPVHLSGTSETQLTKFADPLVESAGAAWRPLHVVITTASTIPADRIPEPIRPHGNDLVVARDQGVTALASGSDGTLWLLDEQQATAVLWIEDEDALPLWEHTSPLRGAARWWSTVQGAAMVHAGAVADGEGCVLLVGDSGAGKSTATMACHGSGLDVLGDDFCFVEPPTGTTPPIGHTMYRLAKLDDRALDLLPHLRPGVVGTAWRGKHLIDLAPGALPPRPIVAICHVTQDPSSPTHATPMSRIEALRAVAPSTIFQQRLWERETWDVLAATVHATRCYRLSVNEPADVADVIRSILDPRSPARDDRSGQTMRRPLTAADVTVIVPARDAATTLGDTLTAIARQDGGAPTVVVVDDGSSDDTAELATHAGAVVIRSGGHGPGAARNRGIETVTTTIVAFCDADDVWASDRLRQDLGAFDDDPELDVLLGRTHFDADDPALLEPYRFDGDDRSASIPHFGAATMRTSVFGRIGPIDESLTNYEDYEWFFRARDLGARIVTHDRIVHSRRMHAGSTSQQHPPLPADLLAVMQRSVLRRRSTPSARAFWFLPEFPPNPGGIGTYAAGLAPALARLGHEMHLLVGWDGPTRTIVDGVDVIREPLRLAFDQASATGIMRHRRRVAELKAEIQPTLYHVHLTDPTPILHLNTGTVAPAPTILTLHNELVEQLWSNERDSLFDRLLRTSTVITGVSTTVARQVVSAIPDIAHRVVTIPNGVTVNRDVAPLPDRPRVLAIGRLMNQKGFDRLIRAMPTVVDRFPDAHVDIIGEGPERPELEALIEQLGLAGHVTLHGHVDRALVAGFMARAQVVVAPSRHEGLPYALLEAAAHGRPIIGSRTGGIDDVIVDGETGRLLDHAVLDDEPAVLGREINAVLDDPDLARRWGSAGRARVERFFSIEVCAAAYDQLYRALTAPRVDVAVIIPARNAARHLRAAIESALASAERVDSEHPDARRRRRVDRRHRRHRRELRRSRRQGVPPAEPRHGDGAQRRRRPDEQPLRRSPRCRRPVARRSTRSAARSARGRPGSRGQLRMRRRVRRRRRPCLRQMEPGAGNHTHGHRRAVATIGPRPLRRLRPSPTPTTSSAGPSPRSVPAFATPPSTTWCSDAGSMPATSRT